MKSGILAASLAAMLVLGAACAKGPSANNSNISSQSPSPEEQKLSVVDRPQKIKDLMSARGDQDNALPVLKVLAPKDGESISSSTVKVKIEISGDLRGYMPGMNEETHTGNHIHVILDDQPYEAYYNLEKEFELRNVSDGDHILRVFPSRPWHESYKNDGAFQMVKFSVKNGGADTTAPATANGQPMSNANTAGGPTPEGKDMKQSGGGQVDAAKPLLTYSRPKGEYKSDDANAIMIDFWLSNAKLKDDGGDYRVRYFIDGGTEQYIYHWAPVWITGWANGKHTIKLELVDAKGQLVDNGGYNSVTREITIAK